MFIDFRKWWEWGRGRERMREKEREREKGRERKAGEEGRGGKGREEKICSDWELNLQPFGIRDNTPTN